MCGQPRRGVKLVAQQQGGGFCGAGVRRRQPAHGDPESVFHARHGRRHAQVVAGGEAARAAPAEHAGGRAAADVAEAAERRDQVPGGARHPQREHQRGRIQTCAGTGEQRGHQAVVRQLPRREGACFGAGEPGRAGHGAPKQVKVGAHAAPHPHGRQVGHHQAVVVTHHVAARVAAQVGVLVHEPRHWPPPPHQVGNGAAREQVERGSLCELDLGTADVPHLQPALPEHVAARLRLRRPAPGIGGQVQPVDVAGPHHRGVGAAPHQVARHPLAGGHGEGMPHRGRCAGLGKQSDHLHAAHEAILGREQRRAVEPYLVVGAVEVPVQLPRPGRTRVRIRLGVRDRQ